MWPGMRSRAKGTRSPSTRGRELPIMERMATPVLLRSMTVRRARTAAAIALALILIARAVETGNSRLIGTAVAILLGRLFYVARATGRLDGKARLPRRFPLSQVVSTELRGRRLVLRAIDGQTASVPYTTAPSDAELVAQLREGLAEAGVALPDPAEPRSARARAARWALIVGTVIVVSAAVFVVALVASSLSG